MKVFGTGVTRLRLAPASREGERILGRSESASLVQFGFVSRTRGDLPEAALRRLARVTSERNRGLGVTGELTYANGVVSKVMEGRCEDILVLASEILADERYESIEVTGFEPIEVRRHSEGRVSGLDETPPLRVTWG